MRQVVISGYYGFGNGGDEAMLAALVAGLRRLHPTVELTVLSADPAATIAEYGVAAVGRRSLKEIMASLRGADLLISGGGNLLQDVSGPFNIPYYLGLAELARWHGAATMLLGQGIGPVDSFWGRRLIRHLANRVDAITVRDSAAADDLHVLGVTRPPISVAADTVLSLDLKAAAAGIGTDKPAPAGRPLVAVSLRQRGLPEPDRAVLAAALARFTAITGTRLLFVPMHPQEDLPLAQWFVDRLDGTAADISPVHHWRAAAAAFERCEAVIAMRLHALIFAALLDRAPLGLSYEPKVDLFLAQIGLQPVAASDRLPAADLLAQRLAAGYAERHRTVARIAATLPTLRAKADLNFEVAADLMLRTRAPGADPAREQAADNYKSVTGRDTLRRQGRNG